MTSLNRELVEAARATSAADYARAAASLQMLARRIVGFWSTADVVLTPTLALPPVPIGWQEEVEGAFAQLRRNVEFTPFTSVANLTGLPAMSPAPELERRAPGRRPRDRPSRRRGRPSRSCSPGRSYATVGAAPADPGQLARLIRIDWPGVACSIRAALPREIASDIFL